MFEMKKSVSRGVPWASRASRGRPGTGVPGASRGAPGTGVRGAPMTPRGPGTPPGRPRDAPGTPPGSPRDAPGRSRYLESPPPGGPGGPGGPWAPMEGCQGPCALGLVVSFAPFLRTDPKIETFPGAPPSRKPGQ